LRCGRRGTPAAVAEPVEVVDSCSVAQRARYAWASLCGGRTCAVRFAQLSAFPGRTAGQMRADDPVFGGPPTSSPRFVGNRNGHSHRRTMRARPSTHLYLLSTRGPSKITVSIGLARSRLC
jgi:hypothetical protein